MRTVPEAVIAFLDSEDFEHTLRLAVSLGGDSDTLAAITGSIAEAYYQQIPSVIIEKALVKLPDEMKEVFI
ncbi:ADP-ribosylglycohydrolase family protein [Neisseria yangbaofengii]|uniref:ADP-ribosylglycohydrolase family protein n=1 Tax=Neisseria yangbaofengii TaxID=2709396 RepID=UPI003531180C